jgi:hypothetical protein
MKGWDKNQKARFDRMERKYLLDLGKMTADELRVFARLCREMVEHHHRHSWMGKRYLEYARSAELHAHEMEREELRRRMDGGGVA